MPTEQEAKPAVVTPSLQQWRSPSTFRGAPGEDPLKWLKEYDRVANFNKWDDMMCLANVYFFLDGTARQWYVNNEDALDSWEAFKNGLSGLFGDRQKYGRRTTKMPSPHTAFRREYTVLHTKCIRTLPRGPVDERNQRHSKFYQMVQLYRRYEAEEVGRPRFERLPNVVPVASLTDETDLVSLIRTIVREEVHRLVNQSKNLWTIPNP
ncbi:retrotrans_gag domain-containing protein [Trichonephila clavipes]|nr:retrotrans_gag domain-containing protein [Trichonephila clavipes]